MVLTYFKVAMNFFLMVGMSYLFCLILMPDLGSHVLGFFPWLLILISFPHFMVTYWIWLKRVSGWKNEIWPIFFPFLYATIFFYSFSIPDQFLNIELLLKVSYAYMLYHFAQQLFGVFSWLNGSYGIKWAGWRKQLARCYFILPAFYSWIELETRLGVKTLFYYPVSSWPIPSDYLKICFYLFLALTLTLIFVICVDFFKLKSLMRLIPLATLGVVWLWFIPPLNENIFVWLPVLHGLQYFPFIFMKLPYKDLKSKLLVGSTSVLSGWLFFRFIPFNMLSGYKIAAPFILSLLNNHHFLIDGRIWKLSDPLNSDLKR